MACCSLTGFSQDIVAGGIYYNIISDTQVAVAPAWVDGANRYEGCIILPERVYCDGVNYDVAAIAPRAFWQSAVTQVQIPNSVTMIGEAAFADAESLTDITLPLGLTAVSRYMLAGTAVTNVALPEGVTEIGMGAFEDCSSLRSVFLPASLRRIGDRAFSYCSLLNEVYSDATHAPALSGLPFEDCHDISVMLPDEATCNRYRQQGWDDEDLFSLWVDEGLAVLPAIQQENYGQSWTAVSLSHGMAYKIYGPDGYLTAITAASRYFLPIGAASTEYLVVPTTMMRDEEDLQLVATAQPTAIEEIDQEPIDQPSILGIDGTIYVTNSREQWVYIYDMYGNLWYRRPCVNIGVSLPGPSIYIVRVGNMVRKVMLN